MLRHMCTSIQGLLVMKDRDLKKVLPYVADENGVRPESVKAFRDILFEEVSQGHRFLRVPECDNFDPVKGCLGHPEYPGE